MISQLLDALHYLHTHNYIHCDIKFDNIFIPEYLETDIPKIWLADLDSVLHVNQAREYRFAIGMKGFRAPEILDLKGFGPKADIWSAGVVFFRLIAGFTLEYGSTRDKKKLRVAVNKQISTLKVAPDVLQLLKGMLEVDPELRMTAEQTLRVGWIRQWLDKHPEQRNVANVDGRARSWG